MQAFMKAQGLDSNKDDKADNTVSRLGSRQQKALTKTNSPRYNQMLSSAKENVSMRR